MFRRIASIVIASASAASAFALAGCSAASHHQQAARADTRVSQPTAPAPSAGAVAQVTGACTWTHPDDNPDADALRIVLSVPASSYLRAVYVATVTVEETSDVGTDTTSTFPVGKTITSTPTNITIPGLYPGDSCTVIAAGS